MVEVSAKLSMLITQSFLFFFFSTRVLFTRHEFINKRSITLYFP